MLRNANLYENRMFTSKVNAALFFGGKGKSVTLIKRVKKVINIINCGRS
jgi:hypothetical protein